MTVFCVLGVSSVFFRGAVYFSWPCNIYKSACTAFAWIANFANQLVLVTCLVRGKEIGQKQVGTRKRLFAIGSDLPFRSYRCVRRRWIFFGSKKWERNCWPAKKKQSEKQNKTLRWIWMICILFHNNSNCDFLTCWLGWSSFRSSDEVCWVSQGESECQRWCQKRPLCLSLSSICFWYPHLPHLPQLPCRTAIQWRLVRRLQCLVARLQRKKQYSGGWLCSGCLAVYRSNFLPESSFGAVTPALEKQLLLSSIFWSCTPPDTWTWCVQQRSGGVVTKMLILVVGIGIWWWVKVCLCHFLLQNHSSQPEYRSVLRRLRAQPFGKKSKMLECQLLIISSFSSFEAHFAPLMRWANVQKPYVAPSTLCLDFRRVDQHWCNQRRPAWTTMIWFSSECLHALCLHGLFWKWSIGVSLFDFIVCST